MRLTYRFLITAILALFMLASVAFAHDTAPNETVLPYFGVVTPLEVQNMDSLAVAEMAFYIAGYTTLKSLETTSNTTSSLGYNGHLNISANVTNTLAYSGVFALGYCSAVMSQSTLAGTKLMRWRIRALT